MNSTVNPAFFNGLRVLVTGASGFIGSHLCARLVELGADVHGVSRAPRNDSSVSQWWQVTLDNEIATRSLVETVEPAIIFHLASFVSGSRAIEHVMPALRSNLLSTVNLLGSVTETGCPRIVLTGSLEETEGDSTTAVPVSPYAAAKSAASTYAGMFHALYNTPVVTARLFMVYGPDQKDHKKLVPYVTLSLLRGEMPRLMSGMREVDWIYVDDVVDAYLALAVKPGIEGNTIDVGSGELTSVRDVVMALVDILGQDVKPAFGSVNDRSMERVRVADIEHAYEIAGWRPSTNLSEGLAKTVDWYCKYASAR